MNNTALFNRDTLIQAIRSGTKPEYLFFWGHSSKPGRPVGKECLSQWYPASFVIDDKTYPTAEHFMMASKAVVFGDSEACESVLRAATPQDAKRIGREIRGFDSERWQAVGFELVIEGNVEKFSQNPTLRDFLLCTGESVLVEASPVDTVWGIGLAADDPAATNPEKWKGSNLLGFALMEVRRRIAETCVRH